MLFINGFPKLLCLYIFVMTILIASLCLRAWCMRHKILEDCVAWLGMHVSGDQWGTRIVDPQQLLWTQEDSPRLYYQPVSSLYTGGQRNLSQYLQCYQSERLDVRQCTLTLASLELHHPDIRWTSLLPRCSPRLGCNRLGLLLSWSNLRRRGLPGNPSEIYCLHECSSECIPRMKTLMKLSEINDHRHNAAFNRYFKSSQSASSIPMAMPNFPSDFKSVLREQNQLDLLIFLFIGLDIACT